MFIEQRKKFGPSPLPQLRSFAVALAALVVAGCSGGEADGGSDAGTGGANGTDSTQNSQPINRWTMHVEGDAESMFPTFDHVTDSTVSSSRDVVTFKYDVGDDRSELNYYHRAVYSEVDLFVQIVLEFEGELSALTPLTITEETEVLSLGRPMVSNHDLIWSCVDFELKIDSVEKVSTVTTLAPAGQDDVVQNYYEAHGTFSGECLAGETLSMPASADVAGTVTIEATF